VTPSATAPERVFVTGALGFIGRSVSSAYRARGAEVRGVDMNAEPASGVAGGEVVAGDVSEPGPWQAHAAGCDLVVHTAAAVSNVADPEQSWRVNVRGTRLVLDAAIAGGSQRFVHFSSAAVYGHARPDPVDERHPVRVTGATYGDTKIAAEQVVLQAHAAREVTATILRPGDVYGPGSRPWTIVPIEMLRRRRVVLPAHGRGAFNPVFIDDLVDAVLLAAEAEAAAGQVFNVTGGSAVDTAAFFAHYSRMLGIAPAPVAPTPVAVAVAEVLGRVTRALGQPSEASAATMRMLAATGTISIDKARLVLGYEPRVSLDEGMRRTEHWLRAEGILV
jgi:nucleoside-diphosphate-sugar epimerase